MAKFETEKANYFCLLELTKLQLNELSAAHERVCKELEQVLGDRKSLYLENAALKNTVQMAQDRLYAVEKKFTLCMESLIGDDDVRHSDTYNWNTQHSQIEIVVNNNG